MEQSFLEKNIEILKLLLFLPLPPHLQSISTNSTSSGTATFYLIPL